MNDKLRFDAQGYTTHTLTLGNSTVTYRAYKDIAYCERPADPIQRLNLFAPEGLFSPSGIGGYTSETAPVFMPNTVGGYMPGPADEPGIDPHTQQPNAIFRALEHGYVVASAGVRGRTTGKVTTEFFEGSKEGAKGEATGRMVGRAPAFIVDYKAAIRYLRHNAGLVPGNVERIVTNGTSAGGALSALAGATGNCAGYAPYLAAIGAADERDDVFAASCYCPIHNLENADAAYEWQFRGIHDYHRTKHHSLPDGGYTRVPDDGTMTDEQIGLSELLADLFPAYVNDLGLVDEQGERLTLRADGSGSFASFVKGWVVRAADEELRTNWSETHCAGLMVAGSQVADQDYLTMQEGKVVDMDWGAYVHRITRMKAAPAFDAVDLTCPENEEFGDEHVDARHFTAFSAEHSTVQGAERADDAIVELMNPVRHLGTAGNDVAPHWRIRHGSFDRDTSLAIPVILATRLANLGYDVDFALPWGLPHSGDYDVPRLFAWVDALCR